MDLNMKWSNRDVSKHLFTKPAFMEHPQCTKPCERPWVSRNSRTEIDLPSQSLPCGNNSLHFYCASTICKAFLQTFVLSTSFFFFNYFILFIYFWLCWVFVATHGLSLVAASGGCSSLWSVGFSLWWLLLLQSTGSRRRGFSSCGTWALERRLSSCGARA